jgi:proline iminopeptidase
MRKLIALALLFLAGAACTGPESRPREGYIDVSGGRVWYRIVGSGRATPLLLVHGGPGAPSYYLERLGAIADERPVIFYDQLGCGRSDRPADQHLWRSERFVEELARVRAALGLKQTHILGHSWGSALPQGTQETLGRHEKAGTTDSAEYQEAARVFYRRHLSRLDPWPPELVKTFEGFGAQVYNTMWGPSEFYATGPLKDYDRTARLGELRLPVLLTAGRYDETTPDQAALYQSLIPNARLEIFEKSAHMTMLDEAERYVEVIRRFLREVGEGK